MYTAWYGTCEDECNAYDLIINDTDNIERIYQFSSTGSGHQSFIGRYKPDYLNSFTTLECGMCYLVVMKVGNGYIEIPGLSFFSYDSVGEKKYLTSSCEFLPIPEDETPTPSPIEEKDCIQSLCEHNSELLTDFQNKFNSNTFTKYQFDFNWGCFCQELYTRKVTIYVEDDIILKIVDVDTQELVQNGEVATYYTMNGLFNFIRNQHEVSLADSIKYKFDKDYFYLLSGTIDYIENAIDDEMGFTVSNFLYNMIEPIPVEPYVQSKAFLNYSGDEADRWSREVIGGDDGATPLYCRVYAEIENIDNEDKLVVRSNGVPNYTPKVGDTTIVGSWQDELSVSSDGNPNIIGEQDYVFKIPLIDVTINPVQSDDDDYYNVVNTGLGPIGISSNGVPLFNPWHNNQNDYLSASRDAMTFATFSSCCGHPSGAGPGRTGAGPYHYHKYPTCIAGNRGLSPTSDIIEEEDMADVIDEKLTKTGSSAHSPILGYMLDGYPVYGPVGTTSLSFDENSSCKILRSSYILYGENYEYVKGSGDLDKCNAIYSATPEYPNGCYHYVLSIDSNEDGTVKRTENPLYIHRDTGTDEIKYIITPMYPYTTVYYRGSNFGSFTNGDSGTSIDPNDDPCAGYMITWGPGIGPKPEDCHQEPPP